MPNLYIVQAYDGAGWRTVSAPHSLEVCEALAVEFHEDLGPFRIISAKEETRDELP